MARKIESKSIENGVVTVKVNGVGEASYDFNTLPGPIRSKLGPFGLDHKLANAGAGKTGQDLVDAMNTMYNALAKGDWKTKIAAPKVSKASIKEKLAGLTEGEASAAMELLNKLGFSL